jgi:hypothetical protein
LSDENIEAQVGGGRQGVMPILEGQRMALAGKGLLELLKSKWWR